MAKVTSKLRIAAHDVIQVVPARLTRKPLDVAVRLQLFDQATERQKQREANRPKPRAAANRGWKREDLYRRGGTR